MNGSDSSMDFDEGDTIAIAFSFEDVVEDLKNPKQVFDSVSVWSEFIGIVSGKPQTVINGFVAKRDIHIDFFSGPEGGKLDGLERAKREEMYSSDRYIYVGTTRRDEVVAEKAGWEYIDFDEISHEGGWEVE